MFDKYRAKKIEKQEQERDDREFDAKMALKNGRKGIEKFLDEAKGSISILTDKAVEAKKKGYDAPYRALVGQLRIAESRKRQAEAFLFQLDAMSEADKLARSSGGLLASMNSIMGAMGQLSFDKNAIIEGQKTYAKSSESLEKQSDMLDKMLGGMDFKVEMAGEAAVSEEEIESKIQSLIGNSPRAETNKSSVIAVATAEKVEETKDDKELESLRRMVNS